MQLNHSSIAAVALISPELARRILTDIFQALVDLSRHRAEARLHFKKCGYLSLFKNRELAF